MLGGGFKYPADWNFEPWSISRFRTCIRHKKRTSATGLDGVTRSDLLAMPDSAVQGLLSFFHQIESTAQWPAQLTVGVVSALEKTTNALTVQQFRPIVIYPMLYRTWSSFRAKQFLRTFQTFAPGGVRGGVPARQARSIWYEIALVMEHAYLMDHHCVGVVADLVKAFNCIPREPIWIVLEVLGCPRWFIQAWMSFVTVQTRRFRVRTSVGPSISSDVGFPEGCALSVAAMALIDHLLDCWMQPVHPSVRVLSFVDDWQILHRAIEAHDEVVRAMFAQAEGKVLKFLSFGHFIPVEKIKIHQLVCGFKHVLCSPLLEEKIPIDEYFSHGLKPPTRMESNTGFCFVAQMLYSHFSVNGIFRVSKDMGPLSHTISHTTPIFESLKDMGIVWEAYHKRVPLLRVPGIALDSGVELKYIDGYNPKDQWCYCWLFRVLLLMAEIPNNHLGCIKPCKYRDKLQINWCRSFFISNR